MSSFYEFTCYGCGSPSDTPLCYLCTCEQCGNILIDGACLKCNTGAGNSFVYDLNPETFNEVQSIFNPSPQPHYNIYLCQICESNSHYGYECLQRVPLVYEPEPCYNQSFSDNAYPHDSPSVTPRIDHHCCYTCGDSLDAIAIKLDLPTVEPEDSLRMGDEHLDTIPEKESDEFIKSSVENLIDSLLDEFAGELILLKSIPPGIDEADCDREEEIRLIEKLLYDNSSPRPPEEFISKNSDAAIESFSPSHILVEDSDSLRDAIDLSLTLDDSMLPGIEDDYDSEGDMIILEELLSNDSLSLPKNESFHFDIPSSLRLLRNHQMMMKLSPTRES
uniref:Pre-mRNA splicing Prp18-interacting factor n=1 Tax=Tanacetum cinerariifolium TaxID=118510 RepID=A0A699H4V1_TANCI|nr:hypothetical protein [Tanacetum cinerariifolium]